MNHEILPAMTDDAKEAETDNLQAEIEALERLSHIAEKWHRELLKVKTGKSDNFSKPRV